MSKHAELTPTVNLIPNPLATRNLEGWIAEGGAVISRDLEHAWEDMGRSVRVDCPGLGSNEAVAVRTVQSLDRTGTIDVDWGQARVAGNNVLVDIWLRGVYSDGTIQDGDRTTVLATRDGLSPGAWHWAKAPAFTANPAKVLIRGEVVTAIASPSGPRSFWVTGAQAEENRDGAHTPFAYGGYGAPWHRWHGAEDASVSVRKPIPLTSPAAGPGEIIHEAVFYRATWDNRWLEDVSDGIITASVSMNTDRPVTRVLTATVTDELWERLSPGEDWIAPYLTITMPDGSVRKGQQGLFNVRESSDDGSEGGFTVSLNAMDPLFLLDKHQGPGLIRVFENSDKMHGVRKVLDMVAFLRGSDGRRRFGGPDSDKRWSRRREWEQDTSFLTFCNDALRSAVMTYLYSTNEGELQWQKRDRQRLRKRTPVRAWSANVPENDPHEVEGIDRRARGAAGGMASEVRGSVRGQPSSNIDNEVVIVHDGPGRRPVWFTHRMRGNEDNPRERLSEAGRRRRRRERHAGIGVADSINARELGEAMAEQMSARNKIYTFQVVPDPSIEYAHETVACAIFNTAGKPAMVGQFEVVGVDWELNPKGTSTQTMHVGRIDSAADAYRGSV